MTEPAAALYAAIDAFQREHRIPGLQHAQIRGLLAEHLARVVPVPPADQTTDRAALRQRIAEVLTGAYLTAPDDSAIMEVLADAVLAVLPEPADRAAVLNEAADAVFAMDFDEYVENDENIDSIREAWDLGTIHGMELLRRLAAEAQPVCAECGHPKGAHREGDDPVTPGTCGACEADDPDEAHHDFAGVRQDGAQQ